MELNREQIIEALECCAKDDCDNCPNPFGNCYSNLAGFALALIRELTEENERFRASSVDYRNIPHIIADAKADTVRKMQERLRAAPMWFVDKDTLDQIAKEMLEEAEKALAERREG